ncbi:hypothetical protein RYX36_023749 [Vicia faba]
MNPVCHMQSIDASYIYDFCNRVWKGLGVCDDATGLLMFVICTCTVVEADVHMAHGRQSFGMVLYMLLFKVGHEDKLKG